MKALALYETSTGNTEFGIEIIRAKLEKLGHECDVLRIKDTNPKEVGDYDLYGFASAINAFGPLTPVYEFMKDLPQLPGKAGFVFSTVSGWPGQSHNMMASVMKKKGMTPLSDHFMVFQDSWPISRRLDFILYNIVKPPLISGIKKTEAFAEKTAELAERFYQGERLELPEYKVLPTFLWMQGVFAVKGVLGKAGLGRSVDLDKCNNCGICAAVCPCSAIEINNGPIFSPACVGCWGCFNMCPQDAILSKYAPPRYYYKGIPKKEKENLLKEAGI